jgi:hypothetical protein
MISPDDLQWVNIIKFDGELTYNSKGFAELPPYEIKRILASMQPLSSGGIKFLPEGTHYADYLQAFTDYPITADTTTSSLGNYFIWYNQIYKVISSQSYQHFTAYTTNHVQNTIVKDNRLKWDGSSINLPIPEIDSVYAPLFKLVEMVTSCFIESPISVFWSSQQELQPNFPYCAISIESVTNIDNTPYVNLGTDTLSRSMNKELKVNFTFYTLDQIQLLDLVERFTLRRSNYDLESRVLAFLGLDFSDKIVDKVVYEDRTIFYMAVPVRFSWIVEENISSSDPSIGIIETIKFDLSVPPIFTTGSAP